ncbi:MAG: ribonuclease HII [Chloroflexia bacterium]
MAPTWDEELAFAEAGLLPVAGVDEVGRGCWAGPVVAAAVVLPVWRLQEAPDILAGVDDSKRLSPRVREHLAGRIAEVAEAIGIGVVSSVLVDALGIVGATRLAMRQAIGRLSVPPRALLLDAVSLPEIPLPQRALFQGDARAISIAAASIVAKVYRDRLMTTWASVYPQYGFERHKGYGTREHRLALQRWGPCPLHRRSFAPVAGLSGLETGVV